MGLLQKMGTSGAGAADNWIPQNAGDAIEGRVIGLEFSESDYQPGVMIPIITLKTDEGARVVRGFHTVLRKEIEKFDVKVGDLLAIRYDGQRPLKKGRYAGRPVHVYTVLAERPGGAEAGNAAEVPF